VTRRLAIVLPTVSPLGGGVAEAARLHVAALAPAGFEKITVHTLDDSMEKTSPEQWAPAGLHLHGYFGPKSYSFAPGLLGSLFAAKPDLVHVHGVWQFHCAAVHAWSLATGKPYVVSPHGMLERWIRARSVRLKGAVSALYQNRFLRNAAGFHLLTDKEVQDVAEFRGAQPATIIRNFVQRPPANVGKPAWWKPKFEGRNVYLFFGRIHEKKGCMELMDAWAKLSSEDSGFRDRSVLVFCGWNDGLEGFEARAAELGERLGNVLFAGPQYGPDKHRAFSVARYFLLPSKSEGLPVAVLEAWASGVPAIMTDECNLPIGFERGAAFRCGYTVDTILPALRAAETRSNDEWRAASDHARALVAAEFSEASVRNGLLELYDAAVRWKAGR